MAERLPATVPAQPGTPCSYPTCAAAKGQRAEAVHVLLVDTFIAPAGTALCAWHSPFDVTPGRADAPR